MKKFQKSTKATLALALATMLAVPVVSTATPTSVEAAELPKPIKMYDFETENGLTFSATAVDNPAKLTHDETRGGKVLTLDNGVAVTAESVEVSTKYAIDYKPASNVAISATEAGNEVSGDVLTLSTTSIIVVDYVNSSVEIDNPFAGKTELVADPVGYLESYAPTWEQGVTISYWMKTTGTGKEETAESPILTFNREKAGMTHKDDRDKHNLAVLYESLDKDGYMFKQLFSTGTALTFTKSDYPKTYRDLPVEDPGFVFWMSHADGITVLEDPGIFATMNPNFEAGEKYYFRLNADKTGYTLQSVTGGKIDLSKYLDVTAEGSEARYGTEQGSFTFLASGGFSFTETGLISEVFKGGKPYTVEKESERQFQRNTLRAYTYLQAGDKDSPKTYVPVVNEELEPLDALVETTEWHYITYVITNGYVSLYVDGVAQDCTMYTDTKTECKLIVGQSFNKGYGYHNDNDSLPFEFPDIKSESGGIGMLKQNEGYLLGGFSTKDDESNIIKNEAGVSQIGYNGNCNADTLMEYLTSAETKLLIGEDGLEEAVKLTKDLFGSKAGTAIDNLAFYDVALTGDEIMEIYTQEAAGKPNLPDDVTPPAVDVVTKDPVEVTKDPVETTKDPVEVTKDPVEVTKDPVDVDNFKAGDADCNEKVDLNDAKLILKHSLGIKVTITEQGLKNADYDKSGKIDLNDAKYTLKTALGIKFTLPSK